VLALFLFGGEVLRGFAFTMLAGTVATTYSGWFIAPSLAIMLSKKPTRVPPRAVVETTASEQHSRKSKSQRKARA
jgi:preprotein translocase subunit SecF